MIAGIPADKTKNGPGIDGYAVSSIDNSRASGGPAYMFGQILPNNQGNLAFDPTPAHPQLEFTITNFNQLINPSKGFWIEGFAGSAEDRYVSTTNLDWTEIPPTIAAQNIPSAPEPSTWLMWSLAASGMVFCGCADAGTGREPEVRSVEPAIMGVSLRKRRPCAEFEYPGSAAGASPSRIRVLLREAALR